VHFTKKQAVAALFFKSMILFKINL